jgi:hypothetical protein
MAAVSLTLLTIASFAHGQDFAPGAASTGSGEVPAANVEAGSGTGAIAGSEVAGDGFAAGETQSFQTLELDLPESTAGILLLLGGLTAVIVLCVRTSLRDSRFLPRTSRIAMLIPRLLVLLLLLVVVLNPQRRTQVSRVERSRVGLVLDTSLSMQWPARDAGAAETPAGAASDSAAATGAAPDPEATAAAATDPTESRSAAIQRALLTSGVLQELSRTHAISVYAFDSDLSGPLAVVMDGTVRFLEEAARDGSAATTLAAGSSAPVTLPIDDPSAQAAWQQILQPRGAETRLGESLHQVIGQLSSRALSGVVVVSDGRQNAGPDPETARRRAERSGTRLITVGVGGLNAQPNRWIAGMQSPLDVHQGDPFEVTVQAQATGISDQPLTIKLFQQSADGDGRDRRELASREVKPLDPAVPANVTFSHALPVPGRYELIASVSGADGQAEMTLADNERRRTVEVTDRKIQVLVISSGPMREYQFVRNTLFRHGGIQSDVWLQTVTEENAAMVSQEATRLLTEFPETEAELFDYDVIIAFDPDWSRLSSGQQQFLNRWVSEHAGGLVVVAGEIFTPQLAQDPDAFREISVLYPVLLTRMAPDLKLSQRADEAWPVNLTTEGRATGFLKIIDASGNASADLWEAFRGVYRSYPVRGLRDGATVLLEYGNPRARTELGPPPFLASQFFGSGRTIFVGAAETWRLRELSTPGHQQFWTSLIREVGQGRRSRGSSRGQLLLDRTEVAPGQPVTIRAQLFDARLQPLAADSVSLAVSDSAGRTLTVPDRLLPDASGAGRFVNTFRPPQAGMYRIAVPVPDSTDVLQAVVDVVVPNVESRDPTQDVPLLTALTRDTQGRYLTLEGISELPQLLPDQSQPVVVDERLNTLWDRAWMLYAMTGLLAVEWILRRVWRLS